MRVFRGPASLLGELNALDASTRRTASTASFSNRLLIASIPTSHAASCPAQRCKHPATRWMSSRAILEGLTLILAVSASHQSQLASLLAINAIFVLDLARGLWSSKVGITSLLSWLCSPMLWHHCMLLSVGITQRQSQFLPSPPGNFKQVSFPAYYFIRLVHLR